MSIVRTRVEKSEKMPEVARWPHHSKARPDIVKGGGHSGEVGDQVGICQC